MATIAFLGTGLIGTGLSEAAARAGHEVRVWNRTKERALPLAAHGATVADTPAEAAAGAERVHLALAADEAVDAVLEALGPVGDAVVIDHTTTSVAGTAARARRLREAGTAFLHCPVFMSPQMCRESRGIMLAAGPEAVHARVADALATMTGKVKYLGAGDHLAAAYKLFGNAMIVTITAGLSDVYAMAAEVGVDPREAHALFETFSPAATITFRGAKMAEGDYAPSFEMTMARKDVRLMLEAAGERPLAVLPGVAARMDALIADGHGDRDLGALAIAAVPPRG